MPDKYIKTLVLSGSLAPWQLLIMLATWSWYGHCHFITSDGTILDANGLHGGVKERDQSKPWFGWETHYDLAKTFPKAVLRMLYEKAVSQIGKPYDWSWIAGFLINNRSWQKQTAWVCFEYAAWVLARNLHVDKNLARITGRQLSRICKVNLSLADEK